MAGNQYQCQWCEAVWNEKDLIADVSGPVHFSPDGNLDVSKLSCRYIFCNGPVEKIPDTLHVYEDTLMTNPPLPEEEFPF